LYNHRAISATMSKPEDNIKEAPTATLVQPVSQTEFKLQQVVEQVAANYKINSDKVSCVFCYQITDGSAVHFVHDSKPVGSCKVRFRNQLAVDSKSGISYLEAYYTDVNLTPPVLEFQIDSKK
jgi:hypothetical protein